MTKLRIEYERIILRRFQIWYNMILLKCAANSFWSKHWQALYWIELKEGTHNKGALVRGFVKRQSTIEVGKSC